MSTTPDRPSLTQQLADHIAGTPGDQIPAPVREHATWLLHDLVAVMSDAGSGAYSTMDRLRSYAATCSGAEGGRSRLFGTDQRAPVETAALVGGVLGYAIDNEAHHTEAVLHPVAAIGPVALAVAEASGATGEQMLSAFVIGVDVAIRVATAFNGAGLYDRGFHPTPVSCVFGAAATTARLLGLDADATRNALGLAGAQAGGLLAWVDDPAEQARPMNVGLAARSGVTAAQLAAAGYPGYPEVFQGKYSVLRAFSDRHDPQRLIAGLGEHYTTTELAYKMHACVAFTHPALDALQTLVSQGLDPEDVAEVELRFPTSGYHVIDANPLRSHCAQYLMALMLTHGVIRFSDVVNDRTGDDPRIARLTAAASVVPDEELEQTYPEFYRSIVTLTLTSGERVVRDITHPVGTAQNPADPADLQAKYDRLMIPLHGLDRARELSAEILAIETAPSVTRLLDLSIAGTGG